MLRAIAVLLVGVPLVVLAAVFSAAMVVAVDDASPGERPTEHVLELHVLAHHLAVGSGEDELGRRLLDGALQVREQLRVDGHAPTVNWIRLDTFEE